VYAFRPRYSPDPQHGDAMATARGNRTRLLRTSARTVIQPAAAKGKPEADTNRADQGDQHQAPAQHLGEGQAPPAGRRTADQGQDHPWQAFPQASVGADKAGEAGQARSQSPVAGPLGGLPGLPGPRSVGCSLRTFHSTRRRSAFGCPRSAQWPGRRLDRHFDARCAAGQGEQDAGESGAPRQLPGGLGSWLLPPG